MFEALILMLFLSIYISSILKFKYIENRPLDFCLVFSIIVPVYMVFIMFSLFKYLYKKNKTKNIFAIFRMTKIVITDLPFIHSLAVLVLSHIENKLDDKFEEEFTDRVFTRVYKKFKS